MRLKNARERGQVLPLATLLIILLLSMVGFGTEVGSAYYLRQSAHAAAESAAMATVLAAMSSVSGSSVPAAPRALVVHSVQFRHCLRFIANSPPKTNLDNGLPLCQAEWLHGGRQHQHQNHGQQYHPAAQQSECVRHLLGSSGRRHSPAATVLLPLQQFGSVHRRAGHCRHRV